MVAAYATAPMFMDILRYESWNGYEDHPRTHLVIPELTDRVFILPIYSFFYETA